MNRRNVILAAFFALLFAFAPQFNCGSDNEKSSKTDAVTSATPGAFGVTLSSTHPGWKDAACLKCHPINHNSGYRAPDCANCHGENGAALRASKHTKSETCAQCHADKHAGLGFKSPSDCATCHKYNESLACNASSDYDVVVIGAGGGGMSAAAALAKAGLKVIVLEKNYKVGGCMSVYTRGDYHMEASLHGFDGLNPDTGMNVDMFKTLGIWDKVKPLKADPVIYRIVYPDFTWDVPSDPEKYRAFLKEKFPEEATGIDNLFTELKDLDRILKAVMKWQAGQGDPPSMTDLDKLTSYMSGTLNEVLAKFIKNIRLHAVFTQLAGFSGTEPSKVSALFFIAMWNSYHWGGYYYFEGGSQSIPDALAEVTLANGGVIRYNSLVTKIFVENNTAKTVMTSDGVCFNAKYVVSNANAQDTLLKMVGEDKLPAEYVAKLKGYNIGLSALTVNLGVNHDYTSLFGSTYEINVNDTYDISEIFKAINDCTPEKTAFSIANYSVVDKTAAPVGKNVITITSQLSFDCQNQWNWNVSHANYKAYKEQLAEHYIQRAEKILPGLSSHIEVMEVATPLTIRGYTLNQRGTIFGWDNTPEQSTKSRLAQQTPIPNLYLAGAWTFPGGGQSAVMISGITAAASIVKEVNKTKK